jgi:GalNAc-alpha-(1->4)-GalNAc-alpha-(1->3)-diNAcBac-PP-undecaprenol alpha-1,4-N-acetyl-D-galactosaminyltransferase
MPGWSRTWLTRSSPDPQDQHDGIIVNMKNCQKLCLVIPSLQAGGMERVMSELSWYFASKGTLDVHLVFYGINREIFYKIPENVTIHKPAFSFNNRIRFLSAIKTLIFLRSVVKKISPAAILSFGEYWNSFVLLALVRTKYRVYVSDRCQPDKDLGFLHNNLRKILYPHSAGVISQTKKAGEIYKDKAISKNICVIGNPIRKIPGNTTITKEKIVLTVGRLISTKHHDKLIEIFLSISDPEWKLKIVGYDHLKQNTSERLLKIISEKDATDRVILEGKQTDVESYYLKSCVFAFTSSSEGFPNVIGEAMSAGLPVVAFDCVAGPSEMINDGRNGYLVTLFDYESFCEKLKLLMENSELRETFGRQARIDILNFSIERVGEQYLKFMNLN